MAYTVLNIIIPPANFVCRGYTVFTLSIRPSVRVSVLLRYRMAGITESAMVAYKHKYAVV